MIPPIITTETLQNGQKPVVEFRLYDSNTNRSFSHVTYYVINVAVGRGVLWINNDNTAHTVTEGNPSGDIPTCGFDSGILSPGQTFRHTFDKPGTVGYFCKLHPFMFEVMVK